MSILRRGGEAGGLLKPPRMYNGCTTVVQRMYKGCTRHVQGLHKGTTRSQYRSNAGATPEQHAYVALASPWRQGRHTGFPPNLAGSRSRELDPALGGVRNPVFSVDEQAGRSDTALVVRML